LRILINGGIRDTAAVVDHLRHVDGVMIGRQAYKEPYWMAELQSAVLSGESGDIVKLPQRTEIIKKMADYAEQQMTRGARLDQISRHMLGLYAGQPGARRWRRFLSTSANLKNAGPEIFGESLKFVERAY